MARVGSYVGRHQAYFTRSEASIFFIKKAKNASEFFMLSGCFFVLLCIKKSAKITPKSVIGIVFDPEKAKAIMQNEGIEKAVAYFQDFTKKSQEEALVLKQLISKKEVVIAKKETTIADNEAHIAKLERMLFGKKSEKYIHEPAEQYRLDFGDELSPEDLARIEKLINKKREEVKKKERTRKKTSKRFVFPSHLKIVETTIEPEGDLSNMVFLKNQVSNFLARRPAEYFINRIIRPIYTPKEKEGSFKTAAMPDSVFEKSLVSASMVAHLLYGKFVMHLPIDRMLKELIREKIPIPSPTIYNWVRLGINRLEILYEYKFNKILNQKYLQVDETTLKVLESEGTNRKKGSCHLGYFWVYYDPIGGSAVFKYQEGRAGAYPQEVLKPFSGYLQTDGYTGYLKLAKQENIIHLNCWAHARRKFEEALSNDKKNAQIALKLIQELYRIEQKARKEKLNSDQRKQLRNKEAYPIYTLIGKWIAANLDKTLPKSPIGKALRYTFDRWDNLGNYFLDGNLEIDNNLVENAIRPVAIGRKNYLFAGTHESAQRNAIMYTFMADCKKHNVNPEAWLNHVLEKIPAASIQELEKLLPQNFKEMDGFS